jgi:hypothetical protein
VWQIAQAEVPVPEEQALDILRAEFPALAETYKPDDAHDPGDAEEPSLEGPA